MGDLLTYSLTDFLLFSPETYYRLFELHNAATWPMPLVMLALSIAILALLRRPTDRQGRVIAGILAACWLWVAYAFHLQRYATINWAAPYFAAAFALEALLLAWTGVFRGRLAFRIGRDATSRIGLGLASFGLAIQPVLGPVTGRSWTGIELFGTAPDPTAITTLGLLLMTTGRAPWQLFAVPLLWCAFGGATLWTMEAVDAPIMPFAALLCLTLSAWKLVRVPCRRQERCLHQHK